MKLLLATFLITASAYTAAECRPSSESQPGDAIVCDHPAGAGNTGSRAADDDIASTQTRDGDPVGRDSGVSPQAYDSTIDDEPDDVTGEACVTKAANGVCLDTGDD